MSKHQEDQTLDCSGLNCPLPVLKTKKTIDAMENGKVLKMISTDPGSINDMNAWTQRTGNELLETIEKGGEFIFYIRKV